MALEWFDSLTNSLGNLAVQGATAYNTIQGTKTSEEEAYLRGQLTAIAAQSQYDAQNDTIKIGDLETSKSSLLWVIGGTIGIIFIGLGIKKLIK